MLVWNYQPSISKRLPTALFMINQMREDFLSLTYKDEDREWKAVLTDDPKEHLVNFLNFNRKHQGPMKTIKDVYCVVLIG